MVTIRTAPGTDPGVRAEDHSLAQLIQRGSLVPVIAGEVLEDLVFGGHERLVASYAAHVGYPMSDPGKLHKVAKYQSLTTGWKDRQLKQDYLDHVANHLLEVTKEGGTDAGRRRLDRTGARPVRGADPREQCGVVPEHLSALQRQAALWDEQGRSSGLLLRDAALAEAEAWAADHPSEVQPDEQEFLAACRLGPGRGRARAAPEPAHPHPGDRGGRRGDAAPSRQPSGPGEQLRPLKRVLPWPMTVSGRCAF